MDGQMDGLIDGSVQVLIILVAVFFSPSLFEVSALARVQMCSAQP